MPTGRITQLAGFWTDWSIMKMDRGIHGVGAEDGYLSLEELSHHLSDLSNTKRIREDAGKSTSFVDDNILDGRKLYQDMTTNHVTKLAYLPDSLLDLPSGARQRACEMLRLDDTTAQGEIDQFCLDHARARYNDMSPTSSGALASKQRALSEIDAVANALGLQ